MTLSRVAAHATAIILTLLVLLIVWQASLAVVMLACSLALVAAVGPVIEILEQRNWPRFLAIGCTLSAIAALVLMVGLALFTPLLSDLERLGQDVAGRLTALQQTEPEHWLLHLADARTAEGTDSAAPEEVSPSALSEAVLTLAGTASGLFELLASLGVCIALALYWLIDQPRLERLWFTLIPIRQRSGAEKLWRSIQREIGAYLRSELAQTLCAVFLLWLGFQVLGLRYAALTAVVAACLSLLPWIGTLLALVAVLLLSTAKLVEPMAPWVELSGWFAALHTVLVLCFLEFWVEPRLFQRDRYSPLLTALVTVAMTMMGGIWGLLFGPPVGYVIQIVWRLLYPLVFASNAEPASLEAITCRLEELQLRMANTDDIPPEIASLLQRLQDIVDAQVESEVAAGSEASVRTSERVAIS